MTHTCAPSTTAEGAHVCVTARRKPELDAAVAAIGADATGGHGDIQVLAGLNRPNATVRGQGRRIGVLFASAGGGAAAASERLDVG